MMSRDLEMACRKIASDICREIVCDRKVHVSESDTVNVAWFGLEPQPQDELRVRTVTVETRNFLTQPPRFPFSVDGDPRNALAYVEAMMMQGVWFSRALSDHDQMLWRREPQISFDQDFESGRTLLKPTMRFGLWRTTDYEAADKAS